MDLDPAQLEREATELGFRAEPLEKVVRLLDLLDALRTHPYLAGRLVLKGGTALNLFVLDLPRLSVDIDLNYVGALDRATMKAERPLVEQAIRAVCERQGLQVRRVPGDHAGGKWRLSYARAQGGTGTLELDLNFVLRDPLWSPSKRASREVLGVAARDVDVLDLHELAAGKLAALFGRTASRDLYDAVRILEREEIDRARLRLGFIVYGAMSRRDWRGVTIDGVALDPVDAERMLVPLLRADLAPERPAIPSWCAELTARCRDLLSAVLPTSETERQFLDEVNDRGVIHGELLTGDPDLLARIENHPGLTWKAWNVRRRIGLEEGDAALPTES
jgi:hypothetical protein